MPAELLTEVAYRAPHAIHSYYFTGYLGGFVREYQTVRRMAGDRLESWFSDDPYFFENLSRILASMESVLELNADSLFGKAQSALITPHLPDAFLLLLTQTGISVRERQFPHTECTRLDAETNLPFRGVFPGSHQGKRCLVGFTSRRAFHWNPEQDLLPHYFFEVENGRSIQKLVPQPTAFSNQFTLMAGGWLYAFQDFVQTSKVKLETKLDSVAYLPDPSCFYGLQDGSGQLRGPVLLRLLPDGGVQPLLQAEDAWQLARNSLEVVQLG